MKSRLVDDSFTTLLQTRKDAVKLYTMFRLNSTLSAKHKNEERYVCEAFRRSLPRANHANFRSGLSAMRQQ